MIVMVYRSDIGFYRFRRRSTTQNEDNAAQTQDFSCALQRPSAPTVRVFRALCAPARSHKFLWVSPWLVDLTLVGAIRAAARIDEENCEPTRCPLRNRKRWGGTRG